jgi:hypothetical protein
MNNNNNLKTPTGTPIKTPKTPKTPRTPNNNKPKNNNNNNNNRPKNNTTPVKKPRSLFNTNINTFVDMIKENKNIPIKPKNNTYKNDLQYKKEKVFEYLTNNNTILNITDVTNTIVSKSNINNSVRGTSSIVFHCIYNNKIAVIKFLDDSIRSRNEIEITKYLAKKHITPKVYKDGEITIDNILYFYFITERYDGDLLNIKIKIRDISSYDVLSNIKNEYNKFHNLLKSQGYYLLHDDISPSNFVFKIQNDGGYIFKLIDFDRIALINTDDAYHAQELLIIDELVKKLRLKS